MAERLRYDSYRYSNHYVYTFVYNVCMSDQHTRTYVCMYSFLPHSTHLHVVVPYLSKYTMLKHYIHIFYNTCIGNWNEIVLKVCMYVCMHAYDPYVYMYVYYDFHEPYVCKYMTPPRTTPCSPSHLDNGPADHSAVRGHRVEVDVVVHVIGLPCNLREGGGRGGGREGEHNSISTVVLQLPIIAHPVAIQSPPSDPTTPTQT